MVNVNGTEFPLAEQSGVLVLEDPSGHQSWALIVDATVEYGDAEFRGDEAPQMKVIATMKPGELLRAASTEEAGEENVLVYSRLLVSLLREERDRYAELQKTTRAIRENWYRDSAKLREVDREHAKALRNAWFDGAMKRAAMGPNQSYVEFLDSNPYPLPEEDEEDEL